MITFLIAYLLVGWIVTSMISTGLALTGEKQWNADDFVNCIPLWPVPLAIMIFALVLKAIEWGIDD